MSILLQKYVINHSSHLFPTLPDHSPTNETMSWTAISILSHHLDAKTLAIASCVCKTWHVLFISDELWKPILTSHFPSLSTLPFPSSPHSLFSLLLNSSFPRPPRLRLPHLHLALDVFSTANAPLLSVVVPGERLVVKEGLFRFRVEVEGEVGRVVWTAVGTGGGVVVVEGRGRCSVGKEVWFSEEVRCGGEKSGVVGEVGMDLNSNGWVSFGLLSCREWRYLSLDDGLRYLQHFLI